MKPKEVLQKAMTAVETGTAIHGDTKRSFEMIAEMWGIYITHAMARKKKVELEPKDVANMMILLKQARSVYGHSEDNIIDIAGYAALAALFEPDEPQKVNFNIDPRTGDANATAKAI